MSRKIGKPTPELVSVNLVPVVHPYRIDMPVTVYTRQSQEEQVGNNSTKHQTVTVPNILRKVGWTSNLIRVNKTDLGASGHIKELSDLQGLTEICVAMERGEVKTVAVSAEDRFFRPPTMKPVTDLIEICRQNDVLILVVSHKLRIYDFRNQQDEHDFIKAIMRASEENTQSTFRKRTGRLEAIQEGKWSGISMSPGYMTNTQGRLPDGSNNPEYHILKPVPSLGRIITTYFDYGVKFAGNLRATSLHISRFGPKYPNWNELQHSLQNGYRLILPPRLELDYPSPNALRSMFTDLRYIGHWTYQGSVVRFDNHEALIDKELFSAVFNYFSDVTPNGEPNPHYSPRVVHRRPSRDLTRKMARPTYESILYEVKSDYELVAVSSHFISRANRWNYVLKVGSRSRRAELIDNQIDKIVFKKLQSTIDHEAVLYSLGEVHQRLQEQSFELKTMIDRESKALDSASQKYVDASSERIASSMERIMFEKEASLDKLESKLQALDSRTSEYKHATQHIVEAPARLVEEFNNASPNVKLGIASVLINRITLRPESPSKNIQMTVHWADNSTNTFAVARGNSGWTSLDDEVLKELTASSASQIDIAVEFPTRKWSSIREKIKRLTVNHAYEVSPKPIRDNETYNQYLNRAKDMPHKAGSGERWTDNDVDLLKQLVRSNTENFEVYRAFPHRTRNSVRTKITEVFGANKQLPGEHQLKRYESYSQFLERTAMNKAS